MYVLYTSVHSVDSVVYFVNTVHTSSTVFFLLFFFSSIHLFSSWSGAQSPSLVQIRQDEPCESGWAEDAGRRSKELQCATVRSVCVCVCVCVCQNDTVWNTYDQMCVCWPSPVDHMGSNHPHTLLIISVYSYNIYIEIIYSVPFPPKHLVIYLVTNMSRYGDIFKVYTNGFRGLK